MSNSKYNLEHVKNIIDVLREVGERFEKCQKIYGSIDTFMGNQGEFKGLSKQYEDYKNLAIEAESKIKIDCSREIINFLRHPENISNGSNLQILKEFLLLTLKWGKCRKFPTEDAQNTVPSIYKFTIDEEYKFLSDPQKLQLSRANQLFEEFRHLFGWQDTRTVKHFDSFDNSLSTGGNFIRNLDKYFFEDKVFDILYISDNNFDLMNRRQKVSYSIVEYKESIAISFPTDGEFVNKPFVICLTSEKSIVCPNGLSDILESSAVIEPKYLMSTDNLYVSVICRGCTTNYKPWKECQRCYYKHPPQFTTCSVHPESALFEIISKQIGPIDFDQNRNLPGTRRYEISKNITENITKCPNCQFQVNPEENRLTSTAPINIKLKLLLDGVSRLKKYLSEFILILLAISTVNLHDKPFELTTLIEGIFLKDTALTIIECELSVLWLIVYIVYEEMVLKQIQLNGNVQCNNWNIRDQFLILFILGIFLFYSFGATLYSLLYFEIDNTYNLVTFIIHRFVYTPYKFGYKMYHVWNYPFTASMDRDKNSRLDVYFNNL